MAQKRDKDLEGEVGSLVTLLVRLALEAGLDKKMRAAGIRTYHVPSLFRPKVSITVDWEEPVEEVVGSSACSGR